MQAPFRAAARNAFCKDARAKEPFIIEPVAALGKNAK